MADTDQVTWTASGGPMTAHTAIIYSETPRTWRDRLFSWPWRPWQAYPPAIVIDLTEPPHE